MIKHQRMCSQCLCFPCVFSGVRFGLTGFCLWLKLKNMTSGKALWLGTSRDGCQYISKPNLAGPRAETRRKEIPAKVKPEVYQRQLGEGLTVALSRGRCQDPL